MENNALVIDDDKNIRDLVGDLLRSAGFEVISCRNGGEAMEAVKNTCFRVIITDYRMPGMQGTEVARLMRSRCPRAFIIGISINCLEREFVAAGANVFIPKLFIIPELMSFLERMAITENGTAKGTTGAARPISEKI